MNNDGYESVEALHQTAAPTQTATSGAAAQRTERQDELVTDSSDSGSGRSIEELQENLVAFSSFVPAAASVPQNFSESIDQDEFKL